MRVWTWKENNTGGDKLHLYANVSHSLIAWVASEEATRHSVRAPNIEVVHRPDIGF